ncbi:MAG: hypothetical protein Cons2KO_09320 [Congregibacter sp.]
MHRILAFTLFISLLPVPSASADECTCLWEGSFADVQRNADLIIAGIIRSHKGNAADVFVGETLRGENYEPSIRVWMQTKGYCRPEIDSFPVGSRWVLALKQITEVPEGGFDPGTPNQSFGRIGDYTLSSCGAYWLNFSGEAVTGNLIDGPRWAREVEMTPVLLSLIRSFVNGKASREALAEAAREDPAVVELILDTKAFIRGDMDLPQ